MKDRRRRAFAWILTFALLISAREFTWATEVTDVTESTETSTETETATETTTETPSESTTDPMDEAAYEAKLKEAGFTDSYLPGLMALHKTYPHWQFVPVVTGLEWDTVIQKESRNSWNLVPKSVDDAKKSTASGAYDWYTNTWTIYDGSSWVGAHPDYIAYCMDPRNFLDEKSIFQFESLSYNEAQTKEGVEAIIKGTFLAKEVVDADGKTLNYAEAFVEIGKETGVSPYHLASRVRQEQGLNGTSSLISGTYSGYEGYYNYFNVAAAGVSTSLVIKNGLAYAKSAGWDTRYKSLLGGAKLLAKNYIAVGQDTLYFQKFNVVNHKYLYSHQYMGNLTAALTEGQKIGEGYEDKQQAFVFRIPVYENMPVDSVSFTTTGNPNNYLKTMEIKDQTLTPSFDGGVTKYSLVVPAGVDFIEIEATAVVKTSTITGIGKIPLETGTNTIEVVCTSQSGVPRTTTLTVVKQEGELGKLTSDVYQIGEKYITGITPGTTVEDFLKNIQIERGSMRLMKADKSDVAQAVATGCKLEIRDENEQVVKSYALVLYGDVNGDGQINVLDMIKVNRHVLELGKLSGTYLSAADANRAGDGANVLDMIMINRHALGLSTINQK